MSLLPGLFAVVLLGVAGAPAETQPTGLVTRLRVLEMDGLDWRDSAHGKLTHIGRQGVATIWIAERSIVESLVESASTTLIAPSITSAIGQPATIRDRKVHNYVAALGRIADGPVNEATKVTVTPNVQQVSDGFDAQITGVPTVNGVRASVTLDHQGLVAIHTVKNSEVVEPDEDEKASGKKPTILNAQYQVPELWSARVAGAWDVPNEGVLLISLGVRTVLGHKGLLGRNSAALRERLAVIEFESTDHPAAAGSCSAPTATVIANRPMPPVPPMGAAGLPGVFPPMPENVAPVVVGNPHGEIFWIHDVLSSDGRHCTLSGRDIATGAPAALAYPPPMAPHLAFNGAIPAFGSIAVPVRPVPWVAAQDPAVAFAETHGSCCPSNANPIDPETRVASAEQATSPVVRGTMPEPPSRNLPPAFDADGEPVALPRLPDETAEKLALQERTSGSAEPRASAQFPASQPSNLSTLARVSTPGPEGIEGTVELRGRVTIRTLEGLVIEADSIVLKPGQIQAAADTQVETTAGVTTKSALSGTTRTVEVVGQAVSDEPPALPAESCEAAPHPAECCPGDPASCDFRGVSTTNPSPANCPEPCCEAQGDDRGATLECRNETVKVAAASLGTKGSAGPLIERVLNSKGIAPDGTIHHAELCVAPLVRSMARGHAMVTGKGARLKGLESAFLASESLAGSLLDPAESSHCKTSEASVSRKAHTAAQSGQPPRPALSDACRASSAERSKVASVEAMPAPGLPSTAGSKSFRMKSFRMALAPKLVTMPDGTLGIDFEVQKTEIAHLDSSEACGADPDHDYQYRLPFGRGTFEVKVRIARSPSSDRTTK